ncbi:MAG TPA: thioesterase family protein [Nitriliruptorales bacterium]
MADVADMADMTEVTDAADPQTLDRRAPGSYRRWTQEHVRFSDTDMLGHVNNVAITALHESGRVRYGFELAEQAASSARPFILAHLAIDFLGELHFPADVRVGAVLLGVGRTSMTVGTAIFTEDDRCVSTAEGVLVHLGGDGPAPIEGDFRALLEAEVPPT